MLFRVLGPLEVDVDGVVVTPGGARARAVLAALLVQPGATVPASRLAEALWGDAPPVNVDNAVHGAVRRLRRALGAAGDRVVTRPTGYHLDLSGASVDSVLFETGCRAARAAHAPGVAARLFDEALALWRGPAFGEFAETFARAAADRLDELRRTAAEDRAAAQLRSGAVDAAVASATDLIAAHPLSDRPVDVVMRALVAAGRTADALAAYRRHREVLRDELGVDPGPELRELHGRILREDLHPPVPRTAPVDRSRLPPRPSELVGRDDELRALREAVHGSALVTVVGPGGVGKTRLALELAHGWTTGGRSVWWVDLVPVPPSRVVEVIAEATGVEIAPGADPVTALCTALAVSDGVLVLDNAEHLLDAVATIVERLREAAPRLAVLTTSRERLALDGEGVQALPPLPLPAGPVPDNPAVRLFLARATGLTPGDVHLDLVAQACHHLDGLPLAIELGAARAAALGLPVLVDRLRDRLDLLAGGRRTADRRHRTLRAVIEWSHDGLEPEEATLFRRLAVFRGAFTLDQAETICADPPEGSLPARAVAPVLARLVEQSLVQPVHHHRFRLLQTLRAFAREQLDETGEHLRLRERHAHDTAARLASVSSRLWTPDEGDAVAMLTGLAPDLHAAWDHAAAHDDTLALRMAADIYDFAYFRQRLDLLRWGLAALDRDIDDPELAASLGTAAAAQWSAGRLDQAWETAERGIAVAGGQDAPAAALPTEVSADLAMFLGRTEDAVARYRRHAALRRARGEPGPALLADLAVAHALINGLRPDEAGDVLQDLHAQVTRSGIPTAMAWAHYLAGAVAAARSEYTRATTHYRAAIDHGEPADSRLFVTMASSGLAIVAAACGNLTEALVAFPRALDQWVQLGNQAAQNWTLEQIVGLLVRTEADADAAVLAGALRARAFDLPLWDLRAVESALATARTRLGDAATDAAVATGAALGPAAVLAHTRHALAEAAATCSAGPTPAGRTTIDTDAESWDPEERP